MVIYLQGYEKKILSIFASIQRAIWIEKETLFVSIKW